MRTFTQKCTEALVGVCLRPGEEDVLAEVGQALQVVGVGEAAHLDVQGRGRRGRARGAAQEESDAVLQLDESGEQNQRNLSFCEGWLTCDEIKSKEAVKA